MNRPSTALVTRADLPGPGVEPMAQVPGLRVRVRAPDAAMATAGQASLVGDVDLVLCTGMDPVSCAVLEAGRRLRIGASTSVGLDPTDRAAAERLAVTVRSTPGTVHEVCADLTRGLLLSARRRIATADRAIAARAADHILSALGRSRG